MSDLETRGKSSPDIEKRTVAFDVRVEERADGRKMLRGHAAVFNQETVIGDYFREVIMPGAFVDTIVEDDQRALWNHDPNYILGRKSNDTLTLSEDKRGLAIEIDPPNTQLIRDLVLAPIERGDVTQMSFSFRIVDGGQEWVSGGSEGLLDLRKVKKCRVLDVSPVVFPAYAGTDIAMRSHEAWQKEQTVEPEQEPPVEESWRTNIELKRKNIELIAKEA